MPLDPSGLALLAAIADAGSLSAAARAAGLSQPALTKQLRKLEEAAGVALFERGVRGVQPTGYGSALLPRARIIRAQVEQGAEELAQLRGRREGQVRIALSHLATIALLPSVLQAFRLAWPDVVCAVELCGFGMAQCAPTRPASERAWRKGWPERTAATTLVAHSGRTRYTAPSGAAVSVTTAKSRAPSRKPAIRSGNAGGSIRKTTSGHARRNA